MAGVDKKPSTPTAKAAGRVMSSRALAALCEDIPDHIAATVELMLEGTTPAARAKAALDLGQHDVGLLIQHKVFDALKAALADKSPEHREGAMLGIAGLSETRYETAGHPCEPYLVDLLPLLLDLWADPKDPVRAAAEKASRNLVDCTSPHAMAIVLPVLYEAMTDIKKKWQTRRGGLVLLGALAHRAPASIAEAVPAIIPIVSECMRDVRKEVVTTAEEVMFAVASVVGNKDIEPFIPALISAISRPKEVPECVHQLSATTFVQQVDAATLAVIVPVLTLGLREPAAAIKRKAVVIVDNMCKLVGIPEYIEPFLPLLAPGVEKVMKETPDPEVRSVAERSYNVLLKSAGTDPEKYAAALAAAAAAKEAAKAAAKAAAAAAKGAKGGKPGAGGKGAAAATPAAAGAPAASEEKTEAEKAAERVAELLAKLQEELTKALEALAADSVKAAPRPAFDLAIRYVATLAARLVKLNNFDAKEWHANAVTPYLAVYLHESEAEAVCKAFMTAAVKYKTGDGVAVEEVDDGEDLCNVEFSLGYGGKILLNTATLHMKRGRRYGLIGPNGCGKSTLMRAIANGQVENFPPADVLKTVYVEHDIQADLADLSVLAYVQMDPALTAAGVPVADMVEALASVGFTEHMRAGPLTALSGGWKMKLALARAMLRKADLMLLDEPTNHLDVKNVKWLVDYLNGLASVTCMIVSHDAAFLDNVITDVIAYESFKLRRYRGNLTDFVKVRPEAKSYYSLDATQFKFSFPEPGYLEGVKTKDKAILKLMNVTFCYPGAEKNILNDVTLYVTLSSRIAVTGANGAGKSTLIKLLTGELLPGAGSVWKHPNARVAYLAQHAFHHIEEHLDSTPSEYIQWRFASGEDRESFEKASRQITEEEEKKMAQVVMFNGQKLVVEQVLRRRKLKGGYEYEVQWVGQPEDKNAWLTREQLTAMGFAKNVDAIDAREAAAAGAHTKPLTAAVIAKHLSEVGLDQEFTLHHRMRGLSGGQKVKVVLGAAMWQNPHILVLDEPSNYLDRDSLGALAGAISEFGGGVVIISHNREFTDHICKATWHVEGGKMTPIGEDYKVATVIEKKAGADEVVDAAGNVTIVKKKQVLSRGELKKKLKERKAKIAKGEDVSDNEELDAMLEAAEAADK